MKMLDLINEAETDKDKNKRHSMDLDSLEKDIRKSKGGMDKDTQGHIDKKRKELALNKAKMGETTEMTSASVATSMRGNGFLNGGIGDKPIKRVTKKKKATKKKA